MRLSQGRKKKEGRVKKKKREQGTAIPFYSSRLFHGLLVTPFASPRTKKKRGEKGKKKEKKRGRRKRQIAMWSLLSSTIILLTLFPSTISPLHDRREACPRW